MEAVTKFCQWVWNADCKDLIEALYSHKDLSFEPDRHYVESKYDMLQENPVRFWCSLDSDNKAKLWEYITKEH